MKKHILGAAALLALLAPGVAAAQGYVGLSHVSNDDTGLDATALSGSGLVGSNIQVDGLYASIDGSGDSIDAWGTGAHLFTRSSNWLLGGYIGYNSIDAGGGSLNEWIGAAQVQFYADRTTFSGDLSYAQSEFFVDIDTTGLDGEVRHFVTDNFSIQGNIGYFDAEADGGASIDGSRYGIGAEWQLDAAPISIYGGWQQVDVDGDDSSSIGIGARWNFGGTLFERNRSGAGLSRPTGFLESLLVGGVAPR